MKRLQSFLIAACLGIFLAAPAPAAEKIKIGFLVKQPEEPWFQTEWAFADKAGADLGLEVMKIAVPDGEKTLNAIDTLAASGAKGFVICVPDTKLGPAVKRKADSYGLKLIAVDDQFVNAKGEPMGNVPLVMMAAAEIGARQGEERHLPGDAAPGVGVIVKLVHDDGADGVGARTATEGDVGQDLGGAAKDGGMRVHGGVAGHHADVFGAEIAAEGEELFVDEGFYRAGVNRAAGRGRRVGAEFLEVKRGGDEGFAGAGGRGEDDVGAGEEFEHGLLLLGVKLHAAFGHDREETREDGVGIGGRR
jgi:hypothetical protein